MDLINLSDIGWPSTEAISRVVREWEPDPATYLGARYLPLNTTDFNATAEALTWDILGPSRGMTHATMLDADPKLVRPRILKTRTVRPAYWREKKRIGERDLLRIRWSGRQDRERAGSRLVMHEMAELDVRVETLMEYTRWQALDGSLAINEEGVVRTIDYELPNAEVDVDDTGAYWNEETATPIDDIQNALDSFDGTDVEAVDIVFPRSVAKALAQNVQVRDLVRQSTTVSQIGTDTVGALLAQLIGEVASMTTYNRGYIDENGDFQRFIAPNRVFLIGRGPSAEPLGEWAATPSLHNGGIDGASGGKFPMADYRGLEDTPPFIELCNGIFGLPVLYHPERVVRMKVLAS